MRYLRFHEDEYGKKRRIELSKCAAFSLALCCLISIFSIIMLVGGSKAIFNAVLHKIYQVTPGTKTFDIWKEIPLPLYMRIHFFNLTNPDEFMNGAKPILQQIGPYVYEEYHTKENIISNSNYTVTYLQNRVWYWNQDLSGDLTEEDLITILNPIPVAASYIIENNLELLFILNKLLNIVDEKTILRRSVKEIIFDGFEDPILDFFQNSVFAENGTFHFIDELFEWPEFLEVYDKFAWFYKRNDTPTFDGVFNMYTGESDLSDVGVISNWNYKDRTGAYDAPCDSVSGSAGELWPVEQKKTRIEIFAGDICTSLRLKYLEEMEDSHDIEGYRYWGSEDTFYNQTYDGETCSYCIHGNCDTPAGLINVEGCKFGAPAYVSFPHFFNADPSLLEEVVGLQPNESEHRFFVDLIPEFGVPLQVAARLQINLKVKPYPDSFSGMGEINILEKVPNVILPLFYFEVLAVITDDLVDLLKPALFFVRSPFAYIFFGVLLGISLLIIAGIIFCNLDYGWK